MMRERAEGGSALALAIVVALAVAGAGGWLWYESRTFEAESERLAGILALGPGKVVADIGAGKGEWTLEMAHTVGPSGRVFSTEIDSERIEDIREAVADAGVGNVTIIEGTPKDTGLPRGCCDAIFLRHVYHHITEPQAMRASLLHAVRPGGFVAIIDFEPLTRLLSVPEGVPENRTGHGMPIDVLVKEMTAEGFDLVRRIDDWFRFDYCVLFRRRTPPQSRSRPSPRSTSAPPSQEPRGISR